LYRLWRVLAPLLEAGFEDFVRRRIYEDFDHLGHQCFDLIGPLHLDVQEDIAARRQLLLDRLTRGSVAVGGVLRPLQEFPTLDHALEVFVIDKVVVHAIGLFRPCRPSRVGDREMANDVVLGQAVDGLANQGRLAAPRGRRDDEQDASSVN
jgi:hypothetical protein